MFAGALLVVGAAATLSAWSSLVSVMEHNRRLQEGLNVAHTSVEQLLALPRGHSKLNGFSASTNAFSEPNGEYAINVRARHATPARGFVELTVNVSWLETRGRRDITLVIFRTE